MFGIVKPAMCLITVMVALGSAPIVGGQETKSAPPAPVPPQITSAKKAFIANAGGGSDSLAQRYSGGPNQSYNQFYAAMKSWERLELVPAPADADLILEIGFTAPVGPTAIGVRDDPQFRLAVFDPKTHVSLWTFTEHVEPANRQGNARKNFDQAMTKLVDDLKKPTSNQ